MTIIGFQFSKLHAVRHGPAKGKINVNRSCNPVNVEEITIGASQKGLRYFFEFSATYVPKIAEITLEGSLTDLVSDADATRIIDAWNKDKRIAAKDLEPVMNAILNRCHVESLIISKELNIPPPMKLPKVTLQKK